MAVNERVQYDINDIPHEQLAPSKSARTSFTAGKATSQPLDDNWPTEFRIPTGNLVFDEASNGPTEVTRVRIIKLGRNTVSDQTLVLPDPSTPIVTTITDAAVWGATVPTHTVTPIEVQDNSGVPERTSGYDWASGA
jgi:hypothetical protein